MIPPTTPLTLLSVEDDPLQQRLICRLLEGAGYRVVTSGSAEEGLRRLAAEPVDMVLMDIMLPGMDGYAATRTLRDWEAETPEQRWHPVIILTANDTPEDWQLASQCGADDYLTKPLKPHQLISKVVIMARLYSVYMEIKRTRKMRSLGQMAAGIAHDFNNILQTINGNAEMLAQDAGDAPQLLESISEIGRAGQRGRQLVDEMMLYVRNQPPPREPLELSTWLAGYAEVLRSQLPAGLALQLKQLAAPRVMANADQLERVMDNLCGNAVKAMSARPDARLILATWQAGEWGGVRVSDNGCGIAAEHLGTIFDPFFTTREVGDGHGLGLAVVDSILDNHDGHIEVESQPGCGTCMTVTLPLIPSA